MIILINYLVCRAPLRKERNVGGILEPSLPSGDFFSFLLISLESLLDDYTIGCQTLEGGGPSAVFQVISLQTGAVN